MGQRWRGESLHGNHVRRNLRNESSEKNNVHKLQRVRPRHLQKHAPKALGMTAKHCARVGTARDGEPAVRIAWSRVTGNFQQFHAAGVMPARERREDSCIIGSRDACGCLRDQVVPAGDEPVGTSNAVGRDACTGNRRDLDTAGHQGVGTLGDNATAQQPGLVAA